MSKVLKIIHYCIVFVVFIISLSVGRWIVLPGINVFIPALEIPPLTGLWQGIMGILSGQVLTAIIVVMLMLWIIYKILIRIFPINLIIKNMTPFKELKRSGIFGLFDALLNIFVSRDNAKTRMIKLFRAIGNFFKGNFVMMRETLREILGIKSSSAVPFSAKAEPMKGAGQEEKDESPFSPEELRRTNEEFQQCIEENVTIVGPDTDSTEKTIANAKNSVVEVQCKIKAMQVAMNNFAYKR
jgi:hypothetical protein